MKKINFTLFISAFAISLFAQTDPLNVTYKGHVAYSETLSNIWGYVTPEGKEYALVGVANGVSIVDVTDPENPTEAFFVNGVQSFWREIKTWGTHAYITNETSNGLMVIDLSDLPNSVSSIDWTPTIPGLGTLSTIHSIFIDDLGYAYLNGSNLNSGGILYVDVFTTPGSPVYVGKGPAIYAHDSYGRNNIAYSAEIYEGRFSIFDVTDKANPILLGSQNTLFNFTHNAWLSDDSSVLFTTDETADATVGAYDISDPANIQHLDDFRPYETLGSGVIPHNVHVWQDWLIVSYYTDGCIIVDGSRPENLVEVGNFDTYIPASTGFAGAWGAYPYLPSGLILISDIYNGLYVLEPNYVRACWLEGQITDASNGSPINGASIELLTTNVFELSAPTGEYKTGFAVAGTYDVLVKKAGYEPATVQAELDNGIVTILDVELIPLTPFAFSGLVIDETTGDPVPNAKVALVNDDFNYEIETDANGNFNIPTFFAGEYEVFAGKWGYKTTGISSVEIDENNNSLILEIQTGYEDIFSLDLGWTIDFNAFSGIWERAEPIGIFAAGPDIYVTPPADVTQDIGNHCYVTGNLSDLQSGVLIGGYTTLTSPEFDLTGYIEPHMSYHTWYLCFNINNEVPGANDLLVRLDNGIESVYVDTFSFTELAEFGWEFSQINIAEHILPTSTMTVSFETSTPIDFSEIVEAGVDFFMIWDNAPVSVKNPVDNNIKLAASPNPSSQDFLITYELENHSNDSRILVYNMLGQLVESETLPDQKGQVFIGNMLEKGIYFAFVSSGNSCSQSLKLVKQ